ncbi:MAG: S8 family serine peptidase [Myxococcota bacterium]
MNSRSIRVAALLAAATIISADASSRVPAGSLGGPLAHLRTSRLTPERADAWVRRLGLASRADALPLLVSTRGPASDHAAALRALGFRVLRTEGASASVEGPLAALDTLAEQAWLRTVIPMPPAQLLAVSSEGVGPLNAAEYVGGDPAISGAGVRVAVVDTEFLGVAAAQTAGELPANTEGYLCQASGCVATEVETGSAGAHGVACAEVIHDVAPEATLMLMRNDGGLSALPSVINEAVALGADVVALSVGYAPLAPMDGRDPHGVNQALEAARAAGVLVVVGAGNGRHKVFSGAYTGNGATGHYFNADLATDSLNNVRFTQGERVDIFLTWDEWDAQDVGQAIARDDFDISLLRRGINTPFMPVATASAEDDIQPGQAWGGTAVQDGDDFPYEHLIFNPDVTDEYWIKIRQKSPQVAPGRRIRLELWSSTGLEHSTAVGSLAFPADSPHVLTVGAASWSSGLVDETYSAQGPTADGRHKPDLMGYAAVHTRATGTGVFQGTSAAAAHVAGAAALLLSADPTLTPDGLQTALLSSASPTGMVGVDFLTGAGLAALPPRSSPTLTVVEPTTTRPANAGRFDAPSPIQVHVRLDTPAGRYASFLGRESFSAEVGGLPAPVTAVFPALDGHVLTVLPAAQASVGLRDLVVRANLGGAQSEGTATTSVNFGEVSRFVEVALVLDRSGSMGGLPMEVAKEAARLFVRLLSPGDLVSVVIFDDAVDLLYPLTELDAEGGATGPALDDNFEQGTQAWTLTGSWAAETGVGLGLTTALSDSPGATATASSDTTATLTQPLDTSALGEPTLRFWQQSRLGTGDQAQLQTSTDGTSWTTLWTGTGVAEGLVEQALPVNATVHVRFRLITGASPGEGWFVDAVRVTDGAAQTVVNDIIDAIDTIYARGATSVGGGLQQGYLSLVNSNAGGFQAIILMTDGQENSPPMVADVLPTVISSGIPVYTVGLGGADSQQLQQIAEYTGGTYAFTDDPNELLDIYYELSQTLGRRSTTLRERGAATSAEPQRYEFVVDPSVQDVMVALKWRTLLEPFQLSLLAPDGTRYDRGNAPTSGFEYSSGSTFIRYRSDEMAVGTWQAEVQWTPHGPPTMPFTLDVSVISDVVVSVSFSPPRATQGEPVVVNGVVSSRAAQVMDISATVRAPNGTGRLLLLRDDGLGADRVAGDSVYSGWYLNTAAVGGHEVQVTARLDSSAGPVSRGATQRLQVDPGVDSDGDNVPDRWEQLHGTNPHGTDSTLDQDGDGLSSEDEYLAGTWPELWDSDGDTIADGRELLSVAQGGTNTDPTSVDTDMGGVADEMELLLGGDPTSIFDDADLSPTSLYADPASLTFPAVAVGQTASLQLRLQSLSMTPLTPAVLLTSTTDPAFTLTDTALPPELFHGAPAVVRVQFAPTTEGQFQGALRLESGDQVLREIPITGSTPGAVPDAGSPPDASDAADAATSEEPDAAVVRPDAGRPDAGGGGRDAAVTASPDAATGGSSTSSGGSGSSSGGSDPGDDNTTCACNTSRDPGAPVLLGASLALLTTWRRRWRARGGRS